MDISKLNSSKQHQRQGVESVRGGGALKLQKKSKLSCLNSIWKNFGAGLKGLAKNSKVKKGFSLKKTSSEKNCFLKTMTLSRNIC